MDAHKNMSRAEAKLCSCSVSDLLHPSQETSIPFHSVFRNKNRNFRTDDSMARSGCDKENDVAYNKCNNPNVGDDYQFSVFMNFNLIYVENKKEKIFCIAI